MDRGTRFVLVPCIAVVLAFQSEEAAPCLIVLANDLLRRSGADSSDILLVDLWVPVELQVVLVLLTMEVVDFIPKLRAVDS